MRGPAFVTFDQADSGLPGALAVVEVEAVYAAKRWVRINVGDEQPGMRVRGSVENGWEHEVLRTVIRMKTGQKYEVTDPVAVVLSRIESVSERD